MPYTSFLFGREAPFSDDLVGYQDRLICGSFLIISIQPSLHLILNLLATALVLALTTDFSFNFFQSCCFGSVMNFDLMNDCFC